MVRRSILLLALALFTTSLCLAQPVIQRKFDFRYAGAAENLPPGSRVRIWLPVPATNDHQSVEITGLDLPGRAKLSTEPIHGNKMVYFETTAPRSGTVSYSANYKIQRSEVKALAGETVAQISDVERELYTLPNRRVPISGRVLKPIADLKAPSHALASARQLYDAVWNHMSYDKSVPGYGKGDSLWACDARTGNCTDFHSLFISFARNRELPSRFEIGFPLPPKRGTGDIGGYHCWAAFFTPLRGWIPVDISEADKHPELKEYYFGSLTADRIGFTTGRDLELVPQQSGPDLNYFIYPHIEVDGEVWTESWRKYTFTDL